MEIVKKTEEYQIIKKRNGRYGVRRSNRTWVTGDEKVKILVAEGLIKAATPPKAPEEAAPETEGTADEPKPDVASDAEDEAADTKDSE